MATESLTPKRTCSVQGCEIQHEARGYCQRHYKRWRKTGDPLKGGRNPIKQCAVEYCKGDAVAHSYCKRHAARWYRHGDPNGGIARNKNDDSCSVEGCDEQAYTAGMCCTHYHRAKRNNGDPHGGVRSVRGGKVKWLKEHAAYSGDECLVFPFPLGKDGYGIVHLGGVAHRAANAMLRIALGDPPTTNHECAHSCGNGARGCVNPNHLRWSTSAENADDQRRHGTLVKGSRHGMSKISESDVLQIRSLAGDMTQQQIADRFGISSGHVSGIISGKEWRWLDG